MSWPNPMFVWQGTPGFLSKKRFRIKTQNFLSTILTLIISKFSISCFRGDLREGERRGGLILYHPYFRPPLPIFNSRVGGCWDLGLPKLLSVISEMTFGPTKNDDDGRESLSLFSLLCCCCYSIALWGCFNQKSEKNHGKIRLFF